jgi:hypothetical protein
MPKSPSRGLVALSLALASLVPAAACKTRDPSEPGLVTATASADPSEPGGAWVVSCRDADPGEGTAAPAEYRFDVRSESSPKRAVVAATVSVMRIDAGGTPRSLATDEPGHALFATTGALVVDYAEGALTGEATTAEAGSDVTHLGVLTLTGDDDANGLAVACAVREQTDDAVAVTATRE